MDPHRSHPRNLGFPFLAVFNALFADLVYSGAYVILDGVEFSDFLFGALEIAGGVMAIGVAVILLKGFMWAHKALFCFYGYLFLVVAYYYAFLEVEVFSSEMYVIMFGGYWVLPGFMMFYVYAKNRE